MLGSEWRFMEHFGSLRSSGNTRAAIKVRIPWHKEHKHLFVKGMIDLQHLTSRSVVHADSHGHVGYPLLWLVREYRVQAAAGSTSCFRKRQMWTRALPCFSLRQSRPLTHYLTFYWLLWVFHYACWCVQCWLLLNLRTPAHYYFLLPLWEDRHKA